MSTSEERWADLADRADVPTVAVWTYTGVHNGRRPTVLNDRWHVKRDQPSGWSIVDTRPELPGPAVDDGWWPTNSSAVTWLERQLGVTEYRPDLHHEPLTLAEAWPLCRQLDAAGEAALARILPATKVRP